jgi:hypothetical protein
VGNWEIGQIRNCTISHLKAEIRNLKSEGNRYWPNLKSGQQTALKSDDTHEH